MLWLLIAITLLGFLLLLFGIRGKVVGTEPRCRKCKFDLTGLNIAHAEAVCPECAAKLAEPKAIRTGYRRKKRAFILMGSVLCLLPAGLLVMVATGNWTSWNTRKPILVLELDTEFGSDFIRDKSLSELRRRDLAQELDSNGERALLHAQAANLQHAVTLDLADLPLLQQAHESGELSERRWNEAVAGIDRVVQTYMDSFAVPEQWGLVRAVDSRLEGDALFPEQSIRTGPTGGYGVLFLIELTSIEIDGVAVDPEDPAVLPINNVRWYKTPTHTLRSKAGSSTSTLKFKGRPEPTFDSPRNTLRNLPPGEYQLTTTWTLEPFVGAAISRFNVGPDALDSAQTLTPRTLTTHTKLQLVESSPSLIEPITVPDRLQGARDYVTFTRVEEPAWGTQLGKIAAESAFRIFTSWQGSSGEEIAMIGHLEFEWGGQRIRPNASLGATDVLPSITLDATRDSGSSGGFGRTLLAIPPESRPATVAIIFVPNLEAAPEYAGAWWVERGTPMPTVAKEIRWEGVPVMYLEPRED